MKNPYEQHEVGTKFVYEYAASGQETPDTFEIVGRNHDHSHYAVRFESGFIEVWSDQFLSQFRTVEG